jgi:hypothetical protein
MHTPERFCRRAMAALAGLFAAQAFAAPVALSDEELSSVSGGDGISLAVHLELNTDLLAGFNVNGTKTYAVLQGLGGVADLFTFTVDLKSRADGPDYIDIGLPGFIGFRQFGFRALGAQTDPNALVTPATSYGAIQLDGTASVTGHVYLWPH